MVFIMVNVFLTILSENYAVACSDKQLDKEDPELFSYLKSVLSSVWSNFCCFTDNNTNENKMVVYKDVWDTIPNRFDDLMNRIQKVKIILKGRI